MSKWNVRCAIHLEKTIGFFRKNRYRWLFALSLLSVTVCLFFLVFLPDTIPVHYDASWQVDRYGSKYEMLLLPATTILVGFLFIGLAKAQRKSQPQNEALILLGGIPALTILNLLQLVFLIQAGLICWNTHELDFASAFLSKGIYLLIGAALVWIGNLMPKIRRNSFMGLRTVWSMKNDEVWQKSQRFGGYSMAVCGGLLMAASVFLDGIVLLILFLTLLIIDMVIDIIASYQIWEKWKNRHTFTDKMQ